MQIAKQELINKEWVLRFEVKESIIVVPFSLIKSSVLFLVMCAMFVLAYNVGQQAAGQQAEYAVYMCTEGCTATAQNNKIVWECPNLNNSDTLKYPGMK
jgi:hypothetical protein